MILQALYKLSEKEHLMEDPDFEPKPVAWLVRISKTGKLLGIEPTHYLPESTGKKKVKPLAKVFMVPKQPTGRAGSKAPACFFVDNAKYVFGLTTKDKTFPAREGKEKSSWFREMIGKCSEATRDEAARAVMKFLEGVASKEIKIELSVECKSNELFAFVYGPDIDLLVHQRPEIREYWKTLRCSGEDKESATQQCLVSGEYFGVTSLFPMIEKVPGGSPARISLVSFNKNAFESYGWDGNQNAPVSRKASEACSTALNRLLHPAYPKPGNPEQALKPLHLRLSEDTAVCFWTPKKAGDDFCFSFAGLLEANPSAVKELYQSIWRGKEPGLEMTFEFYALILSGTQGRVIVRDWFESTVEKVANKIAAHFVDLDIVRNTPKPKEHDHPPQFPLRRLLESLAAEGESKNIPAPYIIQLLHAALHGTAYPFSILQRALERMRAEIGKDEWLDLDRRDARVALIKAVLNRRKRFYPDTTHYPEVKREMDPTNNSEGYILGKLMAVLERIQQAAMENVNASVIDRYFSGASASPKSVFVRLLKNARHHARKAKDNATTAGIAFLTERLIDELASGFDPKSNGFPAHLDLEQQGLFVLGYHHMRHWLWMTKEERQEWETKYLNAPKAYIWHAEKMTVAQ